MLRSRENIIGEWAFVFGVLLALIVGLATSILSIPAIANYSAHIYGVLVILGIIVGSMNVPIKDSQSFLIAGTVLVIVSSSAQSSVRSSWIGVGVGNVVNSVFIALLALFVPATIVVALRMIFRISNV